MDSDLQSKLDTQLVLSTGAAEIASKIASEIATEIATETASKMASEMATEMTTETSTETTTETSTETTTETATETATGTANFHPFPRLPTELRIKIWEMLIPEVRGRLIWVREPGWITMETEKFSSILLSACPESREIYLKRFPMCLEVTSRGVFSDYFGHCFRASFSWYPKGVIYLNPDHDVLVFGYPWNENDGKDSVHWRSTFEDGTDNHWYYEDYDFAFLAKALRREMPRSRFRSLFEFPNWLEQDDYVAIHESEQEDWDTGDTYEDKDGKATEDWYFDGITMHLTATGPFDREEGLKFYHDAKEVSGHDLFQKWATKFTPS
ncbi:hypothetical protein PG996_008934 [Apiospora saccharicola]|uniref:2EXR domain-containing protein n=1 Tax=Apiospora saccharicola TaxID=335842 RepID=A0ABR1V032_9PEZI